MKRFLTSVFAILLTLALPMPDAEAKRFGGGKSSGIQRDSVTQRQADAPAQQTATAPGGTQTATSTASAAGTASTAGKRSWLGPVAGLAAGLGLAALASHLGLGEEFASVLLIALLAMGAFMLFRLLARSQARPANRYGMQYAGATSGAAAPPAAAAAMPGSATSASRAAASLPAGFDAEAFTRQAKLNFIRLQAAFDAGNLDDIRQFTSPEMYAETRLQLEERGSGPQRTEVVMLDAEVLEAVEEANRYVVSVRFHGLIREESDAAAQAFDEVWHLTKPADGGQGWVVAGIQQLG